MFLATQASPVPGAPAKLTASQIWTVESGERRGIGGIHIVILPLLIGIGFVVGAFGSISFPLGFGVNFFWTGIAVQQVGAIWFGAWGVLAGTIFPFFSNAIAGTPFYVSLAYVPANFVQAFLPAWAFRTFKADPRLTSTRDYLILLGAMLLSSSVRLPIPCSLLPLALLQKRHNRFGRHSRQP
jgi:hypothetical protein